MVAYNAVEVTQAAVTLVVLIAAFVVADIRPDGSARGTRSGPLRSGHRVQRDPVADARASQGCPDGGLARTMLGYGFRVYVAILVSFLVIRLDLLLVNAYLGLDAGGALLGRRDARRRDVRPADGGRPQPLLRASRAAIPMQASAEVFRSIAVLYGLVCLVTVPLAAIVIRVFFGTDFEDATSLYYWLLPGIFCLGMLTILSQHFAGRGFPRRVMAIWLVGLGSEPRAQLRLPPRPRRLGRSAHLEHHLRGAARPAHVALRPRGRRLRRDAPSSGRGPAVRPGRPLPR